MLLDCCASPTIAAHSGETALHVALAGAWGRVAESLLEVEVPQHSNMNLGQELISTSSHRSSTRKPTQVVHHCTMLLRLQRCDARVFLLHRAC